MCRGTAWRSLGGGCRWQERLSKGERASRTHVLHGLVKALDFILWVGNGLHKRCFFGEQNEPQVRAVAEEMQGGNELREYESIEAGKVW